MNEIESQLQGKHWIKFKDIPPSIKLMYDLQLMASGMAVGVGPNLKEEFQKFPGAYEIACEYWLNNTIDKAIEGVKIDEMPKM